MMITLLHNAIGPSASIADSDVLTAVDAIERALRSQGHRTRCLACTLDFQAVWDSLTEHRPDVVFNLVESLAGSDRSAHLAAALLADLDLPFTGTPATGLRLTTNKPCAKNRLRAAGLPTPDWALATGPENTGMAPPYIIKAMWEHGSAGLDDSAVIVDGAGGAVRERIALRARQLGHSCFAEQYIDGREFNVALIDDGTAVCALPPAEIDFSAFPPAKPRIVGYAAKWETETFESVHTPRRFEFSSGDASLLDRLRALAVDCWRLFGLAGYARVDFRVDAAGQPWILEVNANPCLSPGAGFAAALARAEIPWPRALHWILGTALRRQDEGEGPSRRAGIGSRADTAHSAGRLSTMELRTEAQPADRAIVREILTATMLFRAAEIDVAVELVDARLAAGPASGYEFVFAEQEGHLVGYVCFGKNALTLYSFEVYWMAVRPEQQGRGIGRLLLEEAERRIGAVAGTRIYLETSGRADYQTTRAFYERCGYRLEAVVEDFYGPGDSKAIYVKAP